MKLKLYITYGYWLRSIAKEHRAANGNHQVTVMARCASKTKFAELLVTPYFRPADKREIDQALRHMRVYGSCTVVEVDHPKYAECNAVAVKDNTIYYCPNHHCPGLGYVSDWFEAKIHITQ